MMKAQKVLRHILGYTFGLSIFMVLIPYALVNFSQGYTSSYLPGLIENATLRTIVAIPFISVGLFFVIWSNIALFEIGKGGPADGFNVAISPRTEHLVTKGPYRYTRNPMVFGAYASYFSIGIYFNSLACLILLTVFFFLTIFYLKKFEEKRLFKDFGNEFLEYKKRVPMIIPFLNLGKIKNVAVIFYWLPRILSILLVLLVTLFAFDVLNSTTFFGEEVEGFFIHLMPAIIILSIIITAWKWELIGGMLLIFLSLYYSVLSYKHLSWILGIGLPVL
ncbi:MAG: isoprenylcysteine carboxylmethyltransferase family protein, partial [Bacteroidota bacterium]|nr:isoprenylcysteine carboxylmethyltransferase family protein [Bacteroidota bacterium]